MPTNTPDGSDLQVYVNMNPPVPGDPTTSGTGGGSVGAIDWRSWLTDWGFDADLIALLDALARKYTPEQSAAFTADALRVIRGHPWHQKMFPGYAAGFAKGLFEDEKGYRMWVNAANDSYRRYHGRDMTTAEMLEAFNSGWNENRLDLELQAGAWSNANRADLNYEMGAFDADGMMSEGDIKALGQQQVGIGNALGAGLQNKVAKAQQRLKRIFEGSLAVGNVPQKTSDSGAGTTLADVGR